ncbi:hypothetical protein [Microscilla marina]|nr:hypothetical protein [Microscilla marina]
MKIIYKSKYQEISFHKKSSTLHFRWNASTLKMEDIEYQKETEQALQYLQKYRPEKTLINLKKFAYTIDPDMQGWVKEHFLNKIVQQQLTNISALVTSDDFFAQKSVEQSLENSIQGNHSRYFSSTEEAIDWLD